jgi:hypothetical protein
MAAMSVTGMPRLSIHSRKSGGTDTRGVPCRK